MRKWINLVERQLVPSLDREAIINHMVDHLLRGLYWDTEARDAKGQPMNDYSADDMAATWHSFGAFPDVGEHKVRDPNFVDDPIFQKKLRLWANERYDEVLAKLAGTMKTRNGMIVIHRLLGVTPGWKPTDGLGIYWTFDADGADIPDAPWGEHSEEKTELWLSGLVAPEHVNWPGTVMANMDWMSGDREHELRVHKGAPIYLQGYEYQDDAHGHLNNIVGETFRA